MNMMNIIDRGLDALTGSECDTINAALSNGSMRRFGAVLNHLKVGYRVNALIAWRVDEIDADKLGERFARFSFTSHVYLREPAANWPYSLYTMIHARSEDELVANVAAMDDVASNAGRIILRTIKEYKKTSPILRCCLK